MITRKKYILLFLFALLSFAPYSLNAKDKLTAKQMEELKEYERRYTCMDFADKSTLAFADSLQRIGKASGNYMVECLGYRIEGNYYDELHQLNKALDAINKYKKCALAHDDNNTYFKARRSEVLAMTENDRSQGYAAAQDLVTEATEKQDPAGLFYAYFVLADIYDRRSNDGAAAECMEKSIEICKQHPELEMQSELPTYYYCAACSYEKFGKTDKAKEYIDIVLNSNLKKDSGIYVYALCLRAIIAFTKEHDTLSFYKYYNEAQKSPAFRRNTAYKVEAMCIDLMLRGKTEEALKEAKNFSTKLLICRSVGDFEHALQYADSIQFAMNEERAEAARQDVSALDLKMDNTALRMKAKQERDNRYVMLYVGIVILVVLTAVFSGVLWWRERRTRMLLIEKNAMLQSERDKATLASNMKTNFIRNMTHELRTPLNIIGGFSQIIASNFKELQEEEVVDMTKNITDNIESLTIIINDLIYISSFDSNDVQFHLKDMTMSQLLTAAQESFPTIRSEEVRLSVKCNVGDDVMLNTDQQQVCRALRLLVDNAEKFTKQGTISVVANKLDDDKVVISVTDTGCGVPNELREKIFERFFKVDEFVPGAGLGLPLARIIAESLGGSLTLDDNYKETLGARFLLVLPVKSGKAL